MPRVFLLTSPGGPTGALTQAHLALANSPQFASKLAETPFRHLGDYASLSQLRKKIAHFSPSVLHAVGSAAAATAAMLRLPLHGLRSFPRLVVSGCDSPQSWLAKRGLKAADLALAYSPGEVDRYRPFIPESRIGQIRPGVANFVPSRLERGKPTRRTIAAVGNFDRNSGLKTAVWAFDVLKYVDPQLRLLLLGDGPDRAEVDRFGRSLGYDDYRVEFAGLQGDVPRLLSEADVVWITHERGGMTVALEAMAAGTPVVAFRTVDTESVLTHRETGILVQTCDRVQLASATAELLTQPHECARLGGQGRLVAARFSAAALAAATAAAYDAPSEPLR